MKNDAKRKYISIKYGKTNIGNLGRLIIVKLRLPNFMPLYLKKKCIKLLKLSLLANQLSLKKTILIIESCTVNRYLYFKIVTLKEL